jgi:tetratricopeptide (TPR) repeat protein
MKFAALVVPYVLMASLAQAQSHHAEHLGTVDFPVSCSAAAQTGFNRAAALLHHMTYPQALEAFRQVAAIDSTCAMAHWGQAMTLFQPLWPTRPGPEALQRGFESVRRARELNPPTERERLLVASAEAFFLEPTSSDYWLRIRRWAEATRAAHEALPNDPELAALHALALLATAPADSVSRVNADRAAAILLPVFRRNPEHPGAMHYLVHANDIPGRERELLEITRRYDSTAPRNPHALHMPTHIHVRLGDWAGVIRGNLRAAEAAREFPAGDRGQFVWDEYAHAVEYLVYGYLQTGADEDARAELEKLRTTERLEPTFKTAFHLASTTARSALERRDWEEAARIPPREPAGLAWDRFPWAEAIQHFARGFGAARLGRLADAEASRVRLTELEAKTSSAGERLFARNIAVLRLELEAWMAYLAGRKDSSVALMEQAAQLERSTPKHAVTPGPTLPAEELLGDLFLEQKRPGEALAAYRRALEQYPLRFNALLGAARAARGSGDASLARKYYQELVRTAGSSRRPALQEARSF